MWVLMSFNSFLLVVCEKSSIISNNLHHSEILQFASSLSSKWNVYGNTMTVLNSDNLDIYEPIELETAVEIYSNTFLPNVQPYVSCKEFSTHDRTSMLIILNDLEYEDDIIKRHYRWVHYERATLLMIYLNNFVEDEVNTLGQIRSAFQTRSNKKISNAIIIIWSKLNSAINWFAYNYFTNIVYNETGQYDFRQLYYRNTRNFFGFKLKPCFIHKPPFTILKDGELTGPEVQAFDTITKFLNISDDIVEPQSSNLSSYAVIKNYSKNNSCDVYFSKTAAFVTAGLVNPQYPNRLDYARIFLPKGNRRIGVQSVMSPFQKNVWVAICVNFIIQHIIWRILSWFKLSLRSNKFSTLSIFKVQLNTSADLSNAPTALSSLIYIAVAIICSPFVAYAYQSVLVGFLALPIYEKGLKTLKQVEDSGYKIIVQELELNYWRSMTTDTIFSNSFISVPSNSNYAEFMGVDHDFKKVGYMIRDSRFQYLQAMHSSTKYLNFYSVQQPFYSILYRNFFSCDFPYI